MSRKTLALATLLVLLLAASCRELPAAPTAAQTAPPTPESYPQPPRSPEPTFPPLPTMTPWPSLPTTDTPIPSPVTPRPTPEVTPLLPFPTPAFPPTPPGSPPANLGAIWYAYYPSPDSPPVLRAVLVDAEGRRWGEGERSVDLEIESPLTGEVLSGLYSSPDQRLLVAEVAFDITGHVLLVELSNGVVATIGTTLDPSGQGFLAWARNSQELVFQPDTPTGEVWLIDLSTQSHQVLHLPTSGVSGYSIVRAAAFSPDGTVLADASLYHSTSPESPSEVEIGLSVLGEDARTALLRVPGEEVVPHSLAWSPDGQTLIWATMTGLGDADQSHQSIQLWAVDVAGKSANKIADGLALFPPIWSPDGYQIALLKTEVSPWNVKRPPANIYVLNLQTGLEEQVTAFSAEAIVYLAWSPDGKTLGFTMSKGDYGEIWVIGVDGASSHPVAGPTTPEAPFVWLSATGGGK